MEGEKMDSHGNVLKMFSPLKILNSPLSKERNFWSFSSFPFVSLLRMNSKIFEMFEEKIIFSNFLSNRIEVAPPKFILLGELQKIYQQWMHTQEWTCARQYFFCV
jgi:hypothetical protein